MSYLDPCPIPGCTYRAEHYHPLDAGTADEAIGIECSEAAAGRPCTAEGYYYTRCFAPAVKPDLMFALSTVEALIRAAIADAREGLGPLPVEYRAGDDDFYWSDDYQDYDMPEDDSPVRDGEFLKRHYYGK